MQTLKFIFVIFQKIVDLKFQLEKVLMLGSYPWRLGFNWSEVCPGYSDF